MGVYINTLIGGDITIGAGGGGSTGRAETIITFTDNTVSSYDWSGRIDA